VLQGKNTQPNRQPDQPNSATLSLRYLAKHPAINGVRVRQKMIVSFDIFRARSVRQLYFTRRFFFSKEDPEIRCYEA
jgi:hypothetical protein